MTTTYQRFRSEYAAHRASEGRTTDRETLFRLPYVSAGRLAKQWAVRARTFDAFVSRIVEPMMQIRARPLRLLDLGAGNGWLCWRVARGGHEVVAVDVRDDDVDGLGAGSAYVAESGGRFHRAVASFDALPIERGACDIVVFNASLHYALDLHASLREARRVMRRGGRIAILDSPFYATSAHGDAMVTEKHRDASAHFGARAEALMSLPFIEYLTPLRLRDASETLGLVWQRHVVRYPLWYELRPWLARLRLQRPPSRFDLWEGHVA